MIVVLTVNPIGIESQIQGVMLGLNAAAGAIDIEQGAVVQSNFLIVAHATQSDARRRGSYPWP